MGNGSLLHGQINVSWTSGSALCRGVTQFVPQAQRTGKQGVDGASETKLGTPEVLSHEKQRGWARAGGTAKQ